MAKAMTTKTDSSGNIIHLLTNPVVENGATTNAYKDLYCCVDDLFNRLADGDGKTAWETTVRQPVVALKELLLKAIDECSKCNPSIGSTREREQGLACYKATVDMICAMADIGKNIVDWIVRFGSDCMDDGKACYTALRHMDLALKKESEREIKAMPAMYQGNDKSDSGFFDNWQNMAWIGGGAAALAGAFYLFGRKKRRK